MIGEDLGVGWADMGYDGVGVLVSEFDADLLVIGIRDFGSGIGDDDDGAVRCVVVDFDVSAGTVRGGWLHPV